MRRTLALVICVVACSFTSITGVHAAQNKTTASPTNIDAGTFVTMATSSNMLEIQSSEIALKRASFDEVKAFANQMVLDHTKASKEIATILEEKGQTPLTVLNQEHKALLEEWQT